MAKKRNKAQAVDADQLDTYFKQRMHQMGVTDTGALYFMVDDTNPDHAVNSKYKQCIFTESDKGDVEIHYPSIHGGPDTVGEKDFIRTRLKEPWRADDGNLIRYVQPRESGVHVFFPPQVIELIRNKGNCQPPTANCKTGYLVEGEFKAMAGALLGLNIVGLGGKDLFTDGEKDVAKRLHPDILHWIRNCEIDNLVLLLDADVKLVEWDDPEAEPGKDLGKRLKGFADAVIRFRELAKGEVKDIYFMHIHPRHLPEAKGLDDLLFLHSKQQDKILDDLTKLAGARYWFDGHNLQVLSVYKIRALFNLNIIKGVPGAFYQEYWGIIQDREFTFCGARYQYNKVKGELELTRHEDSTKFMRIGCDYFKVIHVPNAKGLLQRRMEPWKAGEITRDYVNTGNKNFFNTIDRFDAACNVPCHTADYQQVIDNCYNLYYPLDHELITGPWDHIRLFLKHIFGEKKLPSGYTNFELALDYITILYRFPTQCLPVLALVSRQNNTGKSTFPWLMEAIFQSNFTEISNKDLADHLNDDWVSKLIVAINEGFIEKKVTMEMIKNMSTAHTVKLRGMYAGRKAISWFGKFILTSNDEANFAPLAEEEEKFWVIKVPAITTIDPDLLKKMKDEVPAFLHYLATREIIHANKSRHWFTYDLIDTEAGRAVKENSKGWLYADLKKKLEAKFIHYRWHTLCYTLEEIIIILNGPNQGKKYQDWDISKTLKEKFMLQSRMCRPEFPREPESQGPMLGITSKKPSGRYYEFWIERFFKEEELRDEILPEFEADGTIIKYEEIIIMRQTKQSPDAAPELGLF